MGCNYLECFKERKTPEGQMQEQGRGTRNLVMKERCMHGTCKSTLENYMGALRLDRLFRQ